MESSVSDLDACRCNPFRGYYDAALQLCPKWTCNFVRFWFATFGIFIMQQTLSFLYLVVNINVDHIRKRNYNYLVVEFR